MQDNQVTDTKRNQVQLTMELVQAKFRDSITTTDELKTSIWAPVS